MGKQFTWKNAVWIYAIHTAIAVLVVFIVHRVSHYDGYIHGLQDMYEKCHHSDK